MIIPVYKATKKIKKGFREMHGRMNGGKNQQPGTSQQPFPGTSPSKKSASDYIDYEEIK